MIDIYISKKLLKGKMSIEVSYSNMFFSDYKIMIIEQPYVYQRIKEVSNYKGFCINFKYLFNKGKKYKMENIEKYIESDLF